MRSNKFREMIAKQTSVASSSNSSSSSSSSIAMTGRRRRYRQGSGLPSSTARVLSPSVLMLCMSTLCHAFVPFLPSTAPHGLPFCLAAKRGKTRGGDEDAMNSWYDDVDDNATPTGVFWEEMERQRLFNQLGGETNADNSREMPDSSSGFNNAGGTSISTNTMGSMPDPTVARKPPSMEEVKSAESTLSQYTLFQVSDNWLDEDLQAYFQQLASMEQEEELSLDEETRRLEDQLEALPDGFGRNRAIWDDSDSEEPWEYFGDDDSKIVDPDRANILIVPEPSPGKCICQKFLDK
jgi:hypothetical protein